MEPSQRTAGWAIATRSLPRCTVFGVLDRLNDGQVLSAERYLQSQTLEELGIEDWDSQLLRALIPAESHLMACVSPPTWRATGVSVLSRKGLAARAEGVRWHRKGGRVLIDAPAGAQTGRLAIVEFVGMSDD